jgi:hypothetical protein
MRRLTSLCRRWLLRFALSRSETLYDEINEVAQLRGHSSIEQMHNVQRPERQLVLR